MSSQAYRTITHPATVEQIIQRSRFIGHCQEVEDEITARTFIGQIRLRHAQATHNCYAYRIGISDRPLEYFNDHGEPSGTAGKPILGAILRQELTNVAVVVTRYYGGKKLGVRGLIDAYGQTATLVLEKAGWQLKIPRFEVGLTLAYTHQPVLLRRLQDMDAQIKATIYTDVVSLRVSIPESNRFLLKELCREFPIQLLENP